MELTVFYFALKKLPVKAKISLNHVTILKLLYRFEFSMEKSEKGGVTTPVDFYISFQTILVILHREHSLTHHVILEWLNLNYSCTLHMYRY